MRTRDYQLRQIKTKLLYIGKEKDLALSNGKMIESYDEYVYLGLKMDRGG